MKRLRTIQTRPNTSVLWPYEVASSSRLSVHPDLIDSNKTLSEDGLTLVSDWFFPDSWTWESFTSRPGANPVDTSAYSATNGITSSVSVDTVPD